MDLPAGWFPLIVRGGQGLDSRYADGVLTLRFHKSPVAAGNSNTFDRLPSSSGAWVDRPVNSAEPSVLMQRMDEVSASNVMRTLRNVDRFWKFGCRNTNTGHFEVLRSEPTSKSVKFDDD